MQRKLIEQLTYVFTGVTAGTLIVWWLFAPVSFENLGIYTVIQLVLKYCVTAA